MHDLSYTAGSDPYMDRDRCVTRLLQEWRTHNQLIVACDFDDTVFDFHGKGYRYDRIIELLKRCQYHGFYIMMFTAQHPDQYDQSRAYLAEKGIIVHTTNCNPVEMKFGHWGKPWWSILLDDRAGLGQAYVILSSVIAEIEKEKGKQENEDIRS